LKPQYTITVSHWQLQKLIGFNLCDNSYELDQLVCHWFPFEESNRDSDSAIIYLLLQCTMRLLTFDFGPQCDKYDRHQTLEKQIYGHIHWLTANTLYAKQVW